MIPIIPTPSAAIVLPSINGIGTYIKATAIKRRIPIVLSYLAIF